MEPVLNHFKPRAAQRADAPGPDLRGPSMIKHIGSPGCCDPLPDGGNRSTGLTGHDHAADG